MPKPIIVTLLILGFLAPASGVVAADLEFSVRLDRDTVSVGDRVRLVMEARHAEGDSVRLLPDVRIPSSLKVLETVPARRLPSDPDQTRIQQTLVVSAFRTGIVEIPAATLRLALSSGDTLTAVSAPLTLFVRSVKPEGTTDIQDIKRPLSVDARVPWWVWGFAAALLAAVVLIVLAIRNRRRRPSIVPPTPPVDWFAEVRALAAAGLAERGEYETLYTRLSEAFRRFLENRTGVEAMERTTAEIARDLLAARIAESRIDDVKALLSEADLVKFARRNPGVDRANADLKRALDLMQRIDQSVTKIARAEAVSEGTEGASEGVAGESERSVREGAALATRESGA